MGMTNCKACGKPARKTSLALVMGASGARSGRVCQKCRGSALVVVAPPSTPAAHRVLERTPTDVAKRLKAASHRVEVFATAAEATADKLPGPSPEYSFAVGRAEGLRAAIEIFRAEFARELGA